MSHPCKRCGGGVTFWQRAVCDKCLDDRCHKCGHWHSAGDPCGDPEVAADPQRLDKLLMRPTAMQRLADAHAALCGEALEVMAKKNADYAAAEHGDVFGNLRMCEHLRLCGTAEGIAVRLSDKLSRVATVLRKGKAEVNETLRDTAIDSVNYWVLLIHWLDEQATGAEA